MAMALLGSFIDVRTIAGIANNASASFAHGLPDTPDFIIPIGAATAASSNTVAYINVLFDATNVTLQNSGGVTSPVLRVTSIVAHSVIR